MNNVSFAGQKFFLTPVCLVPNGRAHLGHIAGPLLKMDVLRRHLVRGGGDVRMVSVSDSHESHVPIRAHQNGTTPEAEANGFHDLIKGDLATLQIAYDDLINPLAPEWADRYEATNREVIALIVDADNAEVRSESIPHLVDDGGDGPPPNSLRPRVGDPVVSGWLRGGCPFCSQPLVGFFCEACGGHFSPKEMKEPGTAHFQGQIAFRNRPSLYLALKGGAQLLANELKRIEVRCDFVEIAQRYLRRNGSSIRLSVPSPWGISLSLPGLEQDEVIWSYSALIYGCHILAGERYRELTGSRVNPMETGSGVTCILSFGVDNTVPFLVGTLGCALAQKKYKSFDALLVNYFYDLEGSKFSTSRNHVIWGGDLVNLGGADADLVRAYLCQHNPEFYRANFDVEAFLTFHNSISQQLRSAIEGAMAKAEGATSLDPCALRYLEGDLCAQSVALDVARFDLAGSYAAVSRWLDRAPALSTTRPAAATWLAGFALLAAPIMPGVSSWVWARLGFEGDPTIGHLPEHSEFPAIPKAGSPVPLRETQLTHAEFNGCLPPHLRR